MSKSKAAFCPECGGVIIIATLPLAETNRETVKDFFRVAKQGFATDYISTEEFRTSDKYHWGHVGQCKLNGLQRVGEDKIERGKKP